MVLNSVLDLFTFLDSEEMIGPPLPLSVKEPVADETEEMIGPPLPPSIKGRQDDSDDDDDDGGVGEDDVGSIHV